MPRLTSRTVFLVLWLLGAAASAQPSGLPKGAQDAIALEAGKAKQVLRLLDSLDELDDVQRVSSNADFPDDVLESYADDQG